MKKYLAKDRYIFIGFGIIFLYLIVARFVNYYRMQPSGITKGIALENEGLPDRESGVYVYTVNKVTYKASCIIRLKKDAPCLVIYGKRYPHLSVIVPYQDLENDEMDKFLRKFDLSDYVLVPRNSINNAEMISYIKTPKKGQDN
ncbi:hypothetical protein FUAX_54930 (plasmid) [Fulvitalea axinellae]|uniref:Uncharacterized protein n=1 Tax=Fulvitalea axinellae TaxID=1182444 RepID=A0AAU9DIU9_9BACT|nr:hypothetical protein FUAX_54930 [Fulvitalea axinellae]